MEHVSTDVRILHVDDNPAHRYAVSRLLRSVGFQVEEAGSGREALAMAGRRPDLILLDMNLPDLTGVEVCKKLRSTSQTSDIPIVHVSATYWDEDWVREALCSGADAYIRYPIEVNRLVQVIQNLVHCDTERSGPTTAEVLAPGSFAVVSGVYEVRHGEGRTEERIYLRGDHLPECDCCDGAVRYKLLQAAPYVFDDEDFRK